MAENQLGHGDVDLEHSFEYELSLDEWDGLMLTEWFDADPGASVPRSSREGEYFYAHENPDAWKYFDRDDLTVEAAKLRMSMEAEVQDVLQPRHLPGKHDQSTHGHGHKGGVAVKERPARKRISAAEARGNSRPVSEEEYDRIADEGKVMLDQKFKNRSATNGLDKNWDSIKEETYGEVQKSWGGATIDSHTGKALPQGADKYAITVKPEGVHTVSVHENASREEFHAAMDTAKQRFTPQLENEGSHLGIFHDDENHRIDIDPVVVIGSLHEVEAIGAHTHAIGGAYHFKSGDGFWPPHVAAEGSRSRQVGLGEDVHWQGPGEWHSYAVEVQGNG